MAHDKSQIPTNLSAVRPVKEAWTQAGIHAHLRHLILDGTLAPGAVLSQVQLARALGVSRTPLREALRMLQEEGLIAAERNRRSRVAGFDSDELEALYAARILLSTLGAALSVPRLTEAEVERLGQAAEAMSKSGHDEDVEGWEAAHKAFHAGIGLHASARLREMIDRLADRSDLYRRLWLRAEPRHWSVSGEEHGALLEACRIRDKDGVVELLARHFSRSALTVMAQTMPEREPAAIRSALQMVLGRHTARLTRKDLAVAV